MKRIFYKKYNEFYVTVMLIFCRRSDVDAGYTSDDSLNYDNRLNTFYRYYFLVKKNRKHVLIILTVSMWSPLLSKIQDGQ